MKKIRKIIVKHFALYYRFRVFGITITALRCTRIMGPYFLLMALVIGLDPAWPVFQWWDIVLMALWVPMIWLTFPWFGWGYFERWPVKREELDDEQKGFYDWYQQNMK